jgi:hypothetical protein
VSDVAVDAAVTKTFSASKWQGALNNLAVGVAKTVCGALGQQDPTGTSTVGLYESLCDGISAGLSGGAAIAAVSQWAKDGADPAKFPIADFVVPIINMSAGATSSYGDSNSPDTPTSVAFNAVTGIIPAVTAVVARAATPEIAKHVKNGDYGAAVLSILPTLGAQLSNALINAMANLTEDNISSDIANSATLDAAASGTAVNPSEEGDFGQEINPLEQGLAEGDSASQIVAAWETANAELLAAVEQRLGVKFDEKLAEAGNADAKTIEQELDAEKQAYQQALDRLSKDQPSDSDFKTIDGLIEDIKRKRAIINLALSVASGGFGIGGASTAVAAIARGLKATADVAKAVKSVIAAVDCVIALNKWLDSYGDAINSASPYASAIENFINSNRDLLCHNSVQALASLAQGIAGYASIAIPPMASAALAMDATASAANLVFQVYRQAALANAWKQTIKSLRNPQNRQLALVVRELNPTLAKYTIAYGAFIARDPIAVRAVGRIGLDRETLSNPNAKLADVKNWLEEVYKDDLTLVADTELDSGAVRVPTPALTVKAWSVAFMQWSKERDGFTPLATPNPPAILANLERVETYRAITDPVPRQAVQPRLLKSLDELASAFASFIALDRGGEPMPDVDNVARAYARLARAALESEQINAAAAASAAKNAGVGQAA